MFILFPFSSLSPKSHRTFTLYFYFFLLFVSFFLLQHRNSHQFFSVLKPAFPVANPGSQFPFYQFFLLFFFCHLPSSPRFHSQGMKNFQYSHFGLAGMELYSKHQSIDVCSEEAFFFLCFFRTSTSVLRKKMSDGLWVWWVSIEESVDMVSLDALLLVCRGSNRWGSWKGGAQRSVGFGELIEGEKAGHEFWRKRRQSIGVGFQKKFIMFFLKK